MRVYTRPHTLHSMHATSRKLSHTTTIHYFSSALRLPFARAIASDTFFVRIRDTNRSLVRTIFAFCKECLFPSHRSHDHVTYHAAYVRMQKYGNLDCAYIPHAMFHKSSTPACPPTHTHIRAPRFPIRTVDMHVCARSAQKRPAFCHTSFIMHERGGM